MAEEGGGLVTRRSELESIRQSILEEIYRMSIELGLDPETLDIDLYATNEVAPEKQAAFGAHCRKLQIVNNKLGEIS